MDGSRFDMLTRTLAGHRTRRGVLAGLGGIFAGAAGLRNAEAACPEGQVNRRGLGCVCRATGRPPGAVGCPVVCDSLNSCTVCSPSDPDACVTAVAAGLRCGAAQLTVACCDNDPLEASAFCCTPGVDCPDNPDGSINPNFDRSRCFFLAVNPCLRG